MKTRSLVAVSIFLLLVVSLACNLGTGKSTVATTTPQANATDAGSSGGNPTLVSPSPTPTQGIVVAASSTPVPPTPAARKLPWGTYRIIGDISDQFLENFPLTGGGAPPLAWFLGTVTLKVEKDSTISGGSAYFHIFTNYTATQQPCDKGEYIYEADQVSGTYDPQTDIITLVYTGTATYDPEDIPARCPEIVTNQVEMTVYLMRGDGNQYILCKTGEQGSACLQNPMAKLNP